MRKMQRPWSLILVALLLLLAANASESFYFFPPSHVSMVNNSTQALLVKCEDRGGRDNFAEADYRVLRPGEQDDFDFDWLVAFFFKFDIVCSVGAEYWEKKCDVSIYNTHTHYYDCLGDGCRWILSDKHILFAGVDDTYPSTKVQWC